MVRMANRVIAAEPKARFAGIEPSTSGGYHWDVLGLLADRGPNTTDYSYRNAMDRVSYNRDVHRGLDISFTDAMNGNYATISKYGRRVERAWVEDDPRTWGWREVLICIDGVPVGFDFTPGNKYKRTPDRSHLYHGHFSVFTMHVMDDRIYNNMGDILLGVPLGGGNMAEFTDRHAEQIHNADTYLWRGLTQLDTVIDNIKTGGGSTGSVDNLFARLFRQLVADMAVLKASAGLVLSDEQLDALGDIVAEKLVARVDNPLSEDDLPTIKQGVREVLREGTGV